MQRESRPKLLATTPPRPARPPFFAQMLAQIGPKTKGLVPKGFDLKDWFVPEGYEFDHRG